MSAYAPHHHALHVILNISWKTFGELLYSFTGPCFDVCTGDLSNFMSITENYVCLV